MRICKGLQSAFVAISVATSPLVVHPAIQTFSKIRTTFIINGTALVVAPMLYLSYRFEKYKKTTEDLTD